MLKFYKNSSGYTLIELITVIGVLAVLFLAVGSILIYMLSSFDMTLDKNSIQLVAQRILTKMTDEIRAAAAEPNDLRIWVSDDSMNLRFYLSSNLADSIKYEVRLEGTGSFLYRSFAGGPEVLVPDFGKRMVDFVEASFSVDEDTVGFSEKGKVNIKLRVGRGSGAEAEEVSLLAEVVSRNY